MVWRTVTRSILFATWKPCAAFCVGNWQRAEWQMRFRAFFSLVMVTTIDCRLTPSEALPWTLHQECVNLTMTQCSRCTVRNREERPGQVRGCGPGSGGGRWGRPCRGCALPTGLSFPVKTNKECLEDGKIFHNRM